MELELERDIRLIRRRLRGDPAMMQRVCVALRSQGLSLPKIGALLNRDHKTVMYHLRRALGG